ncbi:REP-associated tyrosine transposase [Planctomycetaceae bacterium SH139]
MSRSRYRFGDEHYPHFMTDTIVAWLPVLSHPELTQIVFDSWRFLQRERKIDILAFVVMENHLHWIAVGPQLPKRVGEFKSFTASSIVRKMKELGFKTLLQELSYYKLRHKVDQNYQVWQEGSHPKIIESDKVMWQKLEYIHNNPLRRGYIEDPIHWRYSSARNYAQLPGIIDVCTDWM